MPTRTQNETHHPGACFALFMVMLDSTVVNLALPTIQRKIGPACSELQWIIDAYVLALASLLLTGGTLGDMFGRRKAFLGGLALFTGGSLFCALSPSTAMLIGARALQGVGAAIMMPSTLSVLTNTFPDPRERARAIGIWAGISGLALAIGPLIGGAMVDRLGWQSIFLINVPIGVVALVVACCFVPESSDRAGRSLDLPGQVTAVVGLVALTYAFIEANTYGWTSARILSCFVVAALALGLFLVIELRGQHAAAAARVLPQRHLQRRQPGRRHHQLRLLRRDLLPLALHAGGAGLLAGPGRRAAAARHPGHHGRRRRLRAHRRAHRRAPADHHRLVHDGRGAALPDRRSSPPRATPRAGTGCCSSASASA